MREIQDFYYFPWDAMRKKKNNNKHLSRHQRSTPHKHPAHMDYQPTTDDAILLADGIRGHYATQHAAKTLLAQMKDSLLVIRDGTTDDLRAVAVGDDDLTDDQQAVYDDAIYQFERMTFEKVGTGITFGILFDDGNVWLMPEGLSFDNA